MADVLRKRLISQEYVSQFSDNADNVIREDSETDDIISSITEQQEETFWTRLIELDKRATASLQILQDFKSENGLHLSLLTLFILLELLGGAVTLIPVNLALLVATTELHTFSFYFNTLLAQIYDETVKILIKALVGRQRPGSSDARFPRINNFSFPSGHSSRMGMLGYLIVTTQGSSIKFCVFILLFAFIVCSSRVLLGRHYLTDVIGGYVIGTMNGIVFTTWIWVEDEGFENLFIRTTNLTNGFRL